MEAKEADAVLTLPCGYVDKDGRIHKDFSVQGTTGEVRRKMGSPSVRNDSAKLMDTVLEHCITSIGPYKRSGNEPIPEEILKGLLIGDRDFIFLQIRKASEAFAPIVGEAACSNQQCKEKLRLKIPLEEINTVPLNEKRIQMTSAHVRYFNVHDEQLGIDADFRLPNGYDQAEVAKIAARNPIEGNYAIYLRCLLRWGSDHGPFGMIFWDELKTSVIDKIEQEWRNVLPGVDLAHEVECPACGTITLVQLNIADFLLKQPKRQNE